MLSSLQQQAAANPYLSIGAAFEEQRRIAAERAAASHAASSSSSSSGNYVFLGYPLGQDHALHGSSSNGNFECRGIDGNYNLPSQNTLPYAAPALPPFSASGPPRPTQLQQLQALQKFAMNGGVSGSSSIAGLPCDASNKHQSSVPRFILPAHDRSGRRSGVIPGLNTASGGSGVVELGGHECAIEERSTPGVSLGGSDSGPVERGSDGSDFAESTTLESRALDDKEELNEANGDEYRNRTEKSDEGDLERAKKDAVEEEEEENGDAQGKHLRRPSQLSVATLLAEVEGAKLVAQDASYLKSMNHYPPLSPSMHASTGSAAALASASALGGNNGLSNNFLDGGSGGGYDSYGGHERRPSAPGFECFLAQMYGVNNVDPLAEQLRTAHHDANFENTSNGITNDNSSSSSSGYISIGSDATNSAPHERRPSAVEMEQYLAQIQAATEHLQQQQQLQQIQQMQQLQQLQHLNQLQEQLQEGISGAGGGGGAGVGNNLDYSSLLLQLTQAPQFNSAGTRSEVASGFRQHEQQLQQLHLQQQLQMLQHQQDAVSACHLNQFAQPLTGHPIQTALGQLVGGTHGSTNKKVNKRARSAASGVSHSKRGKKQSASRQHVGGTDENGSTNSSSSNSSSSNSSSGGSKCAEDAARPGHRRHVSAPAIVGSRSGSLTPPLILPGTSSQSFPGSSNSGSYFSAPSHAAGAALFAANLMGPPPGLNLGGDDGDDGSSSSSSTGGAMDRLSALLHMASY